MLKTRVLKIFDCLKSLIIKIHVQSEVFDLQRVLREVNHMHRDLAEIIFSLSIFKSDSASQKKEQTEMMMRTFAKNLNVMIKHCNKNVIERLKSRTITQIVAKINTIIDRMKNELRETANVSDISSMNRVLIFQHLRSENIKLFVRKKKNVMFLCQHSQ
jgi:GTPase involved in cell partitioning and DNA repair